MNNTTQTILIGLAVVVAFVLVIILIGNGGPDQTGEQPTSTATGTPTSTAETTPEGWEVHESEVVPVSFAHPPEAEVSAEAGRAKIQLLGPNNEPNTEVTDGLTGYVYTESTDGDVQTAAETMFAAERENSESVISSTTEASFAGRSGFTFRLRNQLGSTSTYYVLSAEPADTALVATFTASGSDADTYVQEFEQIVRTVDVESSPPEDATDNTAPSDDQTATNTPTDTGQNPSYATLCQSADGEWLPNHNECEGVGQSWCTEYGGSYESCASACRHNPEADVCTEQCVQVCSF